MRRLLTSLITGFLVLLTAPLTLLAGEYNDGHDTESYEIDDYSVSKSALKSIDKVAVRVTGFNSEFNRYSVTAEKLKNNAEEQLRAAGFDVVNASASESDASVAFVDLNVDLTLNGRIYTYRVAVDVKQKPSPDSWLRYKTWGKSQVGSIEQYRFASILDYSKNLVNDFINERATL